MTNPNKDGVPDLYLCSAPPGQWSSGRVEIAPSSLDEYLAKGYTCTPYYSAATRIKPMEWRGKPEWCFADTPVGFYMVSEVRNPPCFRAESHGRDRMIISEHPTADTAKRACEVDREARVRSELVACRNDVETATPARSKDLTP